MKRVLGLGFLLCALLLPVAVSAALISPSEEVLLSNSARRANLTLNLEGAAGTRIRTVSGSISLPRAARRLVSVSRRGRFRVNSRRPSARVRFTVNRRRLARLTEPQTFTYTIRGDRRSKRAGLEDSTGTLRVVPGETVSLSITNNFSGDPILPSGSSSSTTTNFGALKIDFKAVEAGVPFNIPFPSNGGSCGVGLGASAPSSPNNGPGGATAAEAPIGAVNQFGAGSATDPLVISFNNAQNGGEDSVFDITGLPSELADPAGVPAFAQFYEGFNASGESLVTLPGTAVVDPDSETITLTADQGIQIVYAKDGGKTGTFQNETLSNVVNDIGGLGTSLDFLAGGTLPLDIPASTIQNALLQSLTGNNSGLTNVSVNVAANVTGTLQVNNGQITGPGTTSVTISFDLPDGNGTATLTGTDNFTMNFTAEEPGQLTGFSLGNPNVTFNITGGTDPIQSMNGSLMLDGTSAAINTGIDASQATVTSFDTVPSLESFQGGDAVQTCIDQCVAGGASLADCTPACQANPQDPQIPGDGQDPVQTCIDQCVAQGGAVADCTPACQADPQNPQLPTDGSGGGAGALQQCLNECAAQGGDSATCQQQCSQFAFRFF